MTSERVPYEVVDGVLLLDKSIGPTSNQALQKARRLCRAKKAGHTGTLDPMATGLLPICFGEATKFSNFALEADKTYLATILLGTTTTTGDAEGQTVEVKDHQMVTQAAVLAALAEFTGVIEQIPPMFSALKHQGKPLYEYAHAGQTVERKSRQVTIYRLTCLSMDLPELTIRVTCSKGTYIRTLACDIGEKLGCGAHLTALRREATGDWTIDQAITLAQLAQQSEPREVLLKPDSLVSHLPFLLLNLEQARQLYLGQALSEFSDGLLPGLYRLYLEEEKRGFIGIGQYREDKTLQSTRLLRCLPE